MKIVTFSTLYPNVVKPTFAVFVENRLLHLTKSKSVSSVVIAPISQIPLVGRFLKKSSIFQKIPAEETRHGMKIFHPRFAHIPIVGSWFTPLFMAIGSIKRFRQLLRGEHVFDLIDAHYFYPDGVAAVILSKWLKKPVVITARGTDINLFPNYFGPRRMILWAAKNANRIITVSQALKARLIDLGVDGEKIVVLRNGVDLDVFKPLEDRDALRKSLGLNGKALVSIGRLEDLKGHDLIIRSLAKLPDVTLLIGGEGPLRGMLEMLARDLGVSERVRFLGAIPHHELPKFYCASDALVLASSREGWPNVLLEAMACGTPAIATRVGGTPEVITKPEAGVLAEERTVDSIVDATRRLFEQNLPRSSTRRYAEQFSWDATSDGQYVLFKSILANQ